jgi:hypothetical protein
MTLLEFREILKKAGIPVAHYKAQLTEYPYIVFRELGTRYNHASGNAWRELTDISIDHFTQQAFDPTLDKLKIVLLAKKINFTTVTIWYEDDETIHTQISAIIMRDMEVGGYVKQ